MGRENNHAVIPVWKNLFTNESNSRRLREAIALALFDVKGNYSGEKYDTSNFRNEENERLEKALLMAFDPYTNKEIMELLKEQF